MATTLPDPVFTTVDAVLWASGKSVAEYCEARGVDIPTTTRCRKIPETCAQLGGITRQKLHALTIDGEITAVRIGRRVMYTQAEIDRFVASCQCTSDVSG